MTLGITTLHYDECRCVECRVLFINMLNVSMLSVVMLSVVTPYLVPKTMNLFVNLTNHQHSIYFAYDKKEQKRRMFESNSTLNSNHTFYISIE
jgi:hypothetical protein